MFSAHPEWSLWAVEAPIESVATAFAALRNGSVWACDILTNPPKKKNADLVSMVPIVQTKGSPWVIGFRSVGYIMESHFDGVPEEAELLSRKLKTRSVSFMRQATAGCIDYRLFERGKVTQKVYTDEDPDTLDDSFRQLGLYIPACLLDEDSKSVFLTVQPTSDGRVERVDIVLLSV